MTPRPVVFVDRDGTLNENVGHLADPRRLRLLPGAADAVRRLNRAEIAVVVVTNQSVIARGLGRPADVARVNDALVTALASGGARLDGIYLCPHHPDFDRVCACRKPGTELLARAVRDLGLDWRRAAIVGDGPGDIEAGRRVGITSVLVSTGHGREVAAEAPWEPGPGPDAIVAGIGDAVSWLLGSGAFDLIEDD